jgi:hypothetical protein
MRRPKFTSETPTFVFMDLTNEISPNENFPKRNRPIYPTQTQQGVNWTLGKIFADGRRFFQQQLVECLWTDR